MLRRWAGAACNIGFQTPSYVCSLKSAKFALRGPKGRSVGRLQFGVAGVQSRSVGRVTAAAHTGPEKVGRSVV
eukprot:586543-Prymnesium_polylepis.1